jgi:hypothetical protein
MVVAAMMLRSILESDEPEARAMYRNFCKFMEKSTIQQAKIDWHMPTNTDNYSHT